MVNNFIYEEKVLDGNNPNLKWFAHTHKTYIKKMRIKLNNINWCDWFILFFIFVFSFYVNVPKSFWFGVVNDLLLLFYGQQLYWHFP